MAGMNFNDLAPEAAVAPEVSEPKKKDNSMLKGIVNDYGKKVQQNPEILEVLYKKKDTLRVVNTCGWGDSGSIVNMKEQAIAEGKSRVIGGTSEVIGYIIENIGNETIQFTNGVWSKNEEGIYVESVINDSLEPGEKKAITRKYLAALAAQPQFSLLLENGQIVTPKPTPNMDADEMLSKCYFKFNDSSKTVHDDAVKIAIAEKQMIEVDGETTEAWVVKPEFEKTFGYKMNPKARAKRTKAVNGAKKADISRAAVADFVNQLAMGNIVK